MRTLNLSKIAKTLGKRGGESTKKKNPNHFKQIGKKGAAKRWEKKGMIIEARLNIEDLLAPGDRLAEGAELTMPDGRIYVFKKGKLKKAA